MNSQTEHSTLGSVAGMIRQALAVYGCNPAPLFLKAGIDIHQLGNPEARFPVRQMQQLWQLAVDTSGDPCFGLTAARQLHPSGLHGLGFAWLASDTLRDALNRLVRFSRLITTAASIQLEETTTGVELVVMPPGEWSEYVYAPLDTGMAFFLRMCRITCGGAIVPTRVTFIRPAPDCSARFDTEFGVSVQFEAERNTLAFDRRLVDATLPFPNPELARINDQAVVDYLERFDRASTALQVRARIIEQLPDGTPNQGTIADSLHVSLRSLQRRLKDENTNYKALLEETRRELALHYIRQSHRPIGEITYLLGFSEPSNFTRAFKRWTGSSPAAFRDRA